MEGLEGATLVEGATQILYRTVLRDSCSLVVAAGPAIRHDPGTLLKWHGFPVET